MEKEQKATRRGLPILSITIALATVVGLLTGGYPRYTNEISTISLLVAMTFSFSSISFRNLVTKDSLKVGLYSIVLNYGLLSGIILMISLLFDGGLRYGFVVMAAVPTAVMVMPLTAILKGKMEYVLVSTSMIYILSAFLTPSMIYILLGREVAIANIIYTTFILILLPLLASRIIRKIHLSDKLSDAVINICFFVLILGIVGKNRDFLFYNQLTVVVVTLMNILRTFGPGIGITWLGKIRCVSREKLIPFSLFASFKNDGLAILLCLSLFPENVAYIATIPCIIAVIVEMCWASCLEIGFTMEERQKKL